VIALPGWLGRGAAGGGTLALTIDENSVRYAFATSADGAAPRLAAWGIEERGHQTRSTFLKRVKAALPAAGRVIAVLSPADYQIVQIDAPNVPADELRGAVRWRASEFFDGSPHDYALDVLTVPGAAGAAAKVIVVAARNDVLRARILDGDALGAAVSIIDVGETTERNLLHAILKREGESRPGAAAALIADAGRALVIITVQGELHFFRRFEFNADLLAVPASEAQPAMVGGGEVAESASRSLMQLQRSLDLWDDSYPHLPLATLHVHAGASTDAIVERIAAEAGTQTRALAVAPLFQLGRNSGEPPWHDPAYLPLLGALLRPEAA
jgi:MSHA biogenesis protein MshI